ncbi:MAG: hypothetical protein NUV77_00345 [Thermoguttaceae bacterium]|jgi:hypothetical protein|nr:hypothetical protein [Thermoguttaceae bacterium]
MKRLLVSLLAASMLAAVVGCANGPGGCDSGCDQAQNCARRAGLVCRRGGDPARGGRGSEAFTPGPPIGQVTYPYYTVRGPRDFLQRVPTPIGP